MQTKYNTARTVMGFIGFVGWVVFGVGIILVLMAISSESQTARLGMGIGISAAIGGLIQAAIAQVSVAVLDMADNSRETLALQRAIAEHEGVPQAVAHTPRPAASVNGQAAGQSSEVRKDASQAAGYTPEEVEGVETYMGEKIEYLDYRHHWNGQKFLTLGKAKAAIKSAKGAGA